MKKGEVERGGYEGGRVKKNKKGGKVERSQCVILKKW